MSTTDSFLNGRDTINTKSAKIFMTINGEVINLIECKKFEAKIEKNKEDVQTLGRVWKGKKVTSVEGTGSLGGYLIKSNWLKYGLTYAEGGPDLYFDATLTIEDATSKAGKQVVLLKDVNLDEIPIGDFESDDGVMEWESDLTFEGIELVEAFNGFSN